MYHPMSYPTLRTPYHRILRCMTYETTDDTSMGKMSTLGAPHGTTYGTTCGTQNVLRDVPWAVCHRTEV